MRRRRRKLKAPLSSLASLAPTIPINLPLSFAREPPPTESPTPDTPLLLASSAVSSLVTAGLASDTATVSATATGTASDLSAMAVLVTLILRALLSSMLTDSASALVATVLSAASVVTDFSAATVALAMDKLADMEATASAAATVQEATAVMEAVPFVVATAGEACHVRIQAIQLCVVNDDLFYPLQKYK